MKRHIISFLFLLSVMHAFAQPKIVAHRGFWRADDSAQNSLTSLLCAAEAGCYGSEFDVWLTADGVPVVYHDDKINDIRIEDTTYATLMNFRLKNGEFLPTLQQYLWEALKYPMMQLIFELKPHRNAEREDRAIMKSLELIRALDLVERTEFISFSLHACEFLHKQSPSSKVAYLNGELSPKEIKAKGLTGIDYHFGVFEKHPEWLTEARKEGVEVNVWTVDGEEALRHYANLKGIDIITTNDPLILKKVESEK